MAAPLSKLDRQFADLQTLLASIAQTNRFYSGRLRSAGYISRLGDFFERMPFTRKEDLVDDQRAHQPFGTNLTYPIDRYVRLWQTSSTSGRPLYWLDTPESMRAMLDNWARVYQAASVTAQDRVFFAFSFGLFLGFWTAFEAAERIGCMRIPGGGMGSAARLRTILEARSTVLCCTPTYALRLAEVAAEEKIDLTACKVRRIIVAGETGGSVQSVRAHIESAWPGAKVVDHHGMTETGPVSYGCPARPGVLHVIESAFIAEVIDPHTARPVQPGATGELVLTTLARTGSPVLRYRTGDLVQRGEPGPCECGSDDLQLPGGIRSRTDDMVVVRGVNIYPSAVEDVLRAVGGVGEYRVEIHSSGSLAEMRLQVEPAPDCGEAADLSARLQAALNAALGLRIPVSTVPRGELPRFEMKARRWVRLPA